MNKKDFAKKMLMKFFIIVTLINVAMFVLGLLYDKNRSFGYEAFMSPIIFGVLSIIPLLVTYSKRELSIKEVIIRKMIQLFLLELLLISFIILNGIFEVKVILPFAITVFVVALIAHLFSWILDSKEAQKLSLELEEYQKKIVKEAMEEE